MGRVDPSLITLGVERHAEGFVNGVICSWQRARDTIDLPGRKNPARFLGRWDGCKDSGANLFLSKGLLVAVDAHHDSVGQAFPVSYLIRTGIICTLIVKETNERRELVCQAGDNFLFEPICHERRSRAHH